MSQPMGEGNESGPSSDWAKAVDLWQQCQSLRSQQGEQVEPVKYVVVEKSSGQKKGTVTQASRTNANAVRIDEALRTLGKQAIEEISKNLEAGANSTSNKEISQKETENLTLLKKRVTEIAMMKQIASTIVDNTPKQYFQPKLTSIDNLQKRLEEAQCTLLTAQLKTASAEIDLAKRLQVYNTVMALADYALKTNPGSEKWIGLREQAKKQVSQMVQEAQFTLKTASAEIDLAKRLQVYNTVMALADYALKTNPGSEKWIGLREQAKKQVSQMVIDAAKAVEGTLPSRWRVDRAKQQLKACEKLAESPTSLKSSLYLLDRATKRLEWRQNHLTGEGLPEQLKLEAAEEAALLKGAWKTQETSRSQETSPSRHAFITAVQERVIEVENAPLTREFALRYQSLLGVYKDLLVKPVDPDQNLLQVSPKYLAPLVEAIEHFQEKYDKQVNGGQIDTAPEQEVLGVDTQKVISRLLGASFNPVFFNKVVQVGDMESSVIKTDRFPNVLNSLKNALGNHPKREEILKETNEWGARLMTAPQGTNLQIPPSTFVEGMNGILRTYLTPEEVVELYTEAELDTIKNWERPVGEGLPILIQGEVDRILPSAHSLNEADTAFCKFLLRIKAREQIDQLALGLTKEKTAIPPKSDLELESDLELATLKKGLVTMLWPGEEVDILGEKELALRLQDENASTLARKQLKAKKQDWKKGEIEESLKMMELGMAEILSQLKKCIAEEERRKKERAGREESDDLIVQIAMRQTTKQKQGERVEQLGAVKALAKALTAFKNSTPTID